MSDDHSTTHVLVPERLFHRVERRVEATQFESVDEYIAFAVEEILSEVETHDEAAESDVDEAEVQSRLESLGYLE